MNINRGVSKRVLRHITKALEVSLESDYKRVRIGACIARNKRTLSRACNRQRSHPLQRDGNLATGRVAPSHFLHAELAAIIRSGVHDLRGATMYVGRYERNGSLGNCRPCDACLKAIRDYGIREVYYTTPHGIEYECMT